MRVQDGGMTEVRIDYDGEGLDESQVPPAPYDLVRQWVGDARRRQDALGDVPEPEAISIATANAQGAPHVRTVLMRYLETDGPGFYTNLESAKASDLAANPQVAGALTWPMMFRAIRFTGTARELPRDVVRTYFDSRPWGSRVGAWVSKQSRPLDSRAELEAANAEMAARYPDTGSPDDVPLPDFWGGYRIDCDEIEFWAGRHSRLHDRLVFVRTAEGNLDDPSAWRLERRWP